MTVSRGPTRQLFVLVNNSELVPEQVLELLGDFTTSLILEAAGSQPSSYIVPAAQLANKLCKLSAVSTQQGLVSAMEAHQRRPEVPMM